MFHPPLALWENRGPFLLPMPIPETAFVWPFPDYPAFSRVALLSSRGVSGSDFFPWRYAYSGQSLIWHLSASLLFPPEYSMHLARIALTGVSVFCSSIFLPPFKFHFKHVRPLLAVQAAEVHVFDEPVSRRPRRDSVLFRPVSKAQDAPPITVKPTVKAGARPYQSHSIPPDLLP